MKKFIILIPLFNDWKSVSKLLNEINSQVINWNADVSVIIVNDASTEPRSGLESNYKKIKSAIANAENNNQYDIDNLYIKEAYVGKSIVLKRFRARAKGRASGIKKPYANLTIILSENINKKKEAIHGSKS